MYTMQRQHFLNSIYFLVLFAFFSTVGCSRAYYSTMEKLGIHKREIMLDRIEKVKDAQQKGEKQFVSSLEAFKELTQFDGGTLENVYDTLNHEYQDSKSAAQKISNYIDDVEDVSNDLFDEWESELNNFSSNELKKDSKRQLRSTQKKFKSLMNAMRDAESKTKPILSIMNDQVLYLKHNLNAKAINSLRDDLKKIDANVEELLNSMQKSIKEASEFISDMRRQ